MRTTVLIFYLVSSVYSFSQEPFGKRFIVSGKQGFTMANFISRDFVGHNRLSVNYVFGKNFMVGIDGNYTYGQYERLQTGTGYYSSIDGGYYSAFWTTPPQIRDLSVGMSLYYFRNKEGGLAPTGRYFFISGSYGIANAYREEIALTGGTQWNPTYTVYKYLNKDSTRTSIIIGIGFGRNFIIEKRLLLGYSLDFGIDVRAVASQWSNRYIMRPSIQIGYTF